MVSKLVRYMRIGILGGSFDPPHMGHLYLGRQFAESLRLDRVLVTPAKVPPHKADKRLAPDRDRLEMCRLTFTEPYFEISDLEMRLPGKSYTVHTLAALKKLYPADALFLLVGSDMLLYFDQWYRWQEILSMCTLCAFSRAADESFSVLQAYNNAVLGGRAVIKNIAPLQISSTEIRAKLAAGASVRGLLPDSVIDYIDKNGLYRSIL